MCIRDRGWRRVKAADALSGKENWVCDDPIRTYVKGTCSVSKLRGKKRSAKRPARRVRIGAPDGSLTALAGLAAVDEVTARLGIVGALDRGIGPIKQRARGLTGGQLLLGMATAQLAGQDCLTGMDRVRADAGSALLMRSAPVAGFVIFPTPITARTSSESTTPAGRGEPTGGRSARCRAGARPSRRSLSRCDPRPPARRSARGRRHPGRAERPPVRG